MELADLQEALPNCRIVPCRFATAGRTLGESPCWRFAGEVQGCGVSRSGRRMAGMARPQFSLRNMLIGVGFLAASFGCFRVTLAFDPGEWFALMPTGVMLFGAGIGAWFDRQFLGIGMGALVALVLSCIFKIAF